MMKSKNFFHRIAKTGLETLSHIFAIVNFAGAYDTASNLGGTKMKKIAIYGGAALLSLGLATPAFADNHFGNELRGQTVDIQFADGTRNAVFFGSTGQATIANATGQTSTANWFVEGDKLCLSSGSATECYGYSAPFSARTPTTMTSDCNAGSVWTARAVNAPVQEVAPDLGERG